MASWGDDEPLVVVEPKRADPNDQQWLEALRALMAARYADADTQEAAMARCRMALRKVNQ